jgi:outer membrane protein assembly factor BamB
MYCNRMIAFCLTLLIADALTAQDWPQWRGPNRDNKVVGFAAPKEWPKELTKKWQVTVGKGEASPLLVGDKLYVFARQGGDEVTVCLDAASGKEIWTDRYAAAAVTGASTKGGHTGPRGTPAVGEGKVCTLGVNGTVSCVDAASGKMVWRKDTKKPQFYTSTSPLIADGKCIVFGDALTAFDLNSGAVKWTGPAGGAPYGSPVLMTVEGTKQVVTPTGSNNLVGVNLADGKQLWQVKLEGTSYFANYSTPLVHGAMIYYSVSAGKGGKGGNTMALKIEKNADGFTAAQVWKKSFAAAGYHTPLLKDGLLFGVSSGKTFFCVDAKTGEELWKDTKARGECGSILDVGPVLLSLTSDKELVAFKASNMGYMEIAKYTVADAPTWSVPIIAGNRVFVKDKGTKDKDGSLTLWTIE